MKAMRDVNVENFLSRLALSIAVIAVATGLILAAAGHPWTEPLHSLPPADHCFGPIQDLLIESLGKSLGIFDCPLGIFIVGAALGGLLWFARICTSEERLRLALQVCLLEIVFLGVPYVLRAHNWMTPAAAVITGDTDRPYIEYCKKQRKSSYDDCILKYELGIMPRQLEHRGGQ
jgi:hypothetical protein